MDSRTSTVTSFDCCSNSRHVVSREELVLALYQSGQGWVPLIPAPSRCWEHWTEPRRNGTISLPSWLQEWASSQTLMTSSVSPRLPSFSVVSTTTILLQGSLALSHPMFPLLWMALLFAVLFAVSSSSDGWVTSLVARKCMGILFCSWSSLPSALDCLSAILPKASSPPCASSGKKLRSTKLHPYLAESHGSRSSSLECVGVSNCWFVVLICSTVSKEPDQQKLMQF